MNILELLEKNTESSGKKGVNVKINESEKKTEKNMQIINKIFEVRSFNARELNTIHYKCINNKYSKIKKSQNYA